MAHVSCSTLLSLKFIEIETMYWIITTAKLRYMLYVPYMIQGTHDLNFVVLVWIFIYVIFVNGGICRDRK